MPWEYDFTITFQQKLAGEPPWRKRPIAQTIKAVMAANAPRSLGGKPKFGDAQWGYIFLNYSYIAAEIDTETETVIFTDIAG